MISNDLSNARWRKSSYTQANGACVELAHLGPLMAVRDSKDADGPVLRFPAQAVTALTSFASAS